MTTPTTIMPLTIQEWKALALEANKEVEGITPSRLPVIVKRVKIQDLIDGNHLPLPLLAVLTTKSEVKSQEVTDKVMSDLASLTAMVNIVVSKSLVSPKIGSGADDISLDMLDLPDKLFITNLAMDGLGPLTQFRQG